MTRKYKTNKKLIAQINQSEIPDDVLRHLLGSEIFTDTGNGDYYDTEEKIFSVGKIGNRLTDPEDDTNETTKLRLENLYIQIRDCVYLRIAQY